MTPGIVERIASPLGVDGVSDWCLIVSDSFIIRELQHLGRVSNNIRTALMTFRLLPPIMGKVFQQHPVSHSVTPADTRESHYIRLLAAHRWWLELNREAARGHRNLSHWPLSDSKSQCQAITQAYLDAMPRALNVPAASMHPSHLRSPTIVNTAPIKAESSRVEMLVTTTNIISSRRRVVVCVEAMVLWKHNLVDFFF